MTEERWKELRAKYGRLIWLLIDLSQLDGARDQTKKTLYELYDILPDFKEFVSEVALRIAARCQTTLEKAD